MREGPFSPPPRRRIVARGAISDAAAPGAAMSEQVTHRPPHPVVYTVLYFPFGALGGFITVALTFLATRHGLSITEGAFLTGASLMMNWLKWIWAPLVDTTLTPKRWYMIATTASAIGVAAMASIPLGPETLTLLLAVITVASLINTMVGMSIEAMMAQITPPDQIGRVSAWFQAGNLGGAGIGGGLGLILLQTLPELWMTGAIFGALFMACCLALLALPPLPAEGHATSVGEATRQVFRDIAGMFKTRSGFLSSLLCFLPVGTGAAQSVLTQAEVAAHWGAGDTEVALVQGWLNGIITALGCFAGGWLCQRFAPRAVYAGLGLTLAGVAVAMAASPAIVPMYLLWSTVYALFVGFAYAAFTAIVLDAMGKGSAATKYTLYATLSNFPIWWLGLLLGYTADHYGAANMLNAEAALGVLGVLLFATVTSLVNRRPETA